MRDNKADALADSIRTAASTIAYDMMSLYTTNATGTPPTAVGTLPAPLYWWEAGAVWGGLIDYATYSNDTSYNPTVTQALLAQVGPDNNYMPPAYYASLGNDDQAFWATSCLSAVEYEFPVPAGNASTLWLDLAEAVFNTQWPRWDTTTCGGGLKWQIFTYNAGYDYKNSISNGGFFQISARLARYTGNQTYVDWAEKAWDWMTAVGLIDQDYNVYDGTNDQINCTQLDHTVWTYNPSMLLYGTAMMYNYTNGSQLWENRTTGLLNAIERSMFSAFPNATNMYVSSTSSPHHSSITMLILVPTKRMYEPACEPSGTCDPDQFSFKAYLSRWMAKASIVAPYLSTQVTALLSRTALAVAQSCSGGPNLTTCGQKWYVGGFDGSSGVGQQLSALETVQALLLLQTPRSPVTAKDVHVVQASGTTSASASQLPSTASTPASRASSDAIVTHSVSLALVSSWATVALGITAAMFSGLV